MKKPPDTPDIAGHIWPPAPTYSNPAIAELGKRSKRAYLTGLIWLDAFVSLPVGFILGLILYAATGLVSEKVYPPPHSQEFLYCDLAISTVITTFFCLLLFWRFRVAGVAMVVGASAINLILLFFTWFGGGMENY